MNDNFCPSHTVVELDTWERGPVFRHFIDDLRCVMSLTVDLEISRFLKQLSASGFRFYPAMIWAVSNVLNAHAEFRYGWDDQGRLVLWDRIEPYYAHFHPDRETFAKLVTPFSSDLETFHRRFLEDRTRYAALDHFDLTVGILTPEGAASSKNHPIASGGVHIRIYCSSPLPANTVSGAVRA